jgi:large subunit ribosomal protein L25
MASSYYKLDIADRTHTRTKGAKAIRREGLIPGVLYYAGEPNVNISVDSLVLYHAMQSGQHIFEIEQDGKTQFTMIKELQYHPVTDEVIHIDLMRVRRSEKMTIYVPLVLVGESIGVKEGGILSQSMTQIEISCFPTDVPDQIELNIDDLDMNSTKSVADITVDIENVEILSPEDLNVVSVHPPAAEEEPEVEEIEGEEGEEGVEGVEGEEGAEDETSVEAGDSKDSGDNSKES